LRRDGGRTESSAMDPRARRENAEKEDRETTQNQRRLATSQ